MTDVLATPVQLGALQLRNRVVMAPLTRSRAQDSGVPTPMMADYYAQRASAGLLVSEATNISPVARGYALTPGIYTDDQVAGWRTVTDAVHAAGGLVVCQLWHTGRVSHIDLHPPHPPVSASSGECRQCRAFVLDTNGVGHNVPASPAVGLTREQIAATVRDYAVAAGLALAAGFDGVEIHAANGYLLHQFMASDVNLRSDDYGGNVHNRTRIVREVTRAVVAAVGADRVGIRLSPIFTLNGISDADPRETFSTVARFLTDQQLAYIHLADTAVMAPRVTEHMDELLATVAGAVGDNVVLNGDYDGDRARRDITAGKAAAVAFGRPFISNPDLPERLFAGAELAEPDARTFYGGDERGYTDYPSMTAGVQQG